MLLGRTNNEPTEINVPLPRNGMCWKYSRFIEGLTLSRIKEASDRRQVKLDSSTCPAVFLEPLWERIVDEINHCDPSVTDGLCCFLVSSCVVINAEKCGLLNVEFSEFYLLLFSAILPHILKGNSTFICKETVFVFIEHLCYILTEERLCH